MDDAINREDIIEYNEFSKAVDVDKIPFEKLMGVFIAFLCDELTASESLQKLGIDDESAAIIRNYADKGKAFLNMAISKESLVAERVSAWKAHKGMPDNSMRKNLLRVVICCLGDEEDAMYDTYGPEELLGAFFSSLLDLGSGYCAQFRYYLQRAFQ